MAFQAGASLGLNGEATSAECRVSRLPGSPTVSEQARIARENRVSMEGHRYQLVGKTEVMEELRREVKRLARLGDTVLILGERGTGKELVARSLHHESRRRGGPFVLVDCSALSATVFESDLFGHERGSFTGAHNRKIGLLEDAHGGTLFFDEVSHLTAALQGKLLRFLEEKTIRRVGGRTQLDVDARVVVATNRDLQQMTEAGEFLPDLFDRINVLRLVTPPLREHLEDIPELVRHFSLLHGLDRTLLEPAEEVLALLQQHPWPGNVRQLFNVLRRVASQGEAGAGRLEQFARAMSY